MARAPHFQINGEALDVPIEKVDRRKIYGWVDRKAFDRDGIPCYTGSLSSDGLNTFGRESFEQGYLNSAGETANALSEKVGDRIFQFTFSYNSSYDPDPAFLLNNSEGLFMVIAQRTDFAFIGKEEEADLAEADEDDADDEDDGDFMDFFMM